MTNDNRGVGQEFQALAQVLEAEKTAQMQLDTARGQAEAILQKAREDSRIITTRTDSRIQALHGRFRENLANKKTNFEEAFQREIDARGTPIGADKFKEVTNGLARQIVGITTE